MPDLSFHLGLTAIAAAPWVHHDWRLAALGALLPDLPKFTRPILDRLINWPPIKTAAILDSFHTPLISGLLALAIGLNCRHPVSSCLILITAAWAHLLIDALQDLPGRPLPLLFPFTPKLNPPALLNPDGGLTLAAGAAAIPITLVTIATQINAPLFQPRPGALAPLLLALILPLVLWRRMLYVPGSELGRLHHRSTEEPVPFATADATVHSTGPPQVRRLGATLLVRLPEGDEKRWPGSGKVTFRGWISGDEVLVDRWRKQPETVKLTLSLAGMAALAALWIKPLIS